MKIKRMHFVPFLAALSLPVLLLACSNQIDVDADYRKDLRPPGITIASPNNGQIVLPFFTVSGTVADIGQITNVTIHVRNTNGGPRYQFEASITNNAFSMVLEMPEKGGYQIYVAAIDDAGNLTNSQSLLVFATGDAFYVSPDGSCYFPDYFRPDSRVFFV